MRDYEDTEREIAAYLFPYSTPALKVFAVNATSPPFYPMRKRPGTHLLEVEWVSRSCWTDTEILAPPPHRISKTDYPILVSMKYL